MCMNMVYTVTKYEIDGPIARITMNNPQNMNALDHRMIEELTSALRDANDDPDVKIIVLTGNGKAFCAGGDVASFQSIDLEGGIGLVKEGGELTKAFIHSPKIIIAAVNGFAVGAGFSMALLSDLVISSDKAKYGAAFINIGLVPDMASLYFLPRVVGLQKAKEIALTGKNMDAEEAHRLGIVNTVVEHDKLGEEVEALICSLADKPGDTMGAIKAMLNKGMDMNVEALMEMEALMQGIRMVSDNSREGVNAFLNKRKPNFK